MTPAQAHTPAYQTKLLLCSLAEDVQNRLHKRNAHRAAQKADGGAANADADQPVEMLPEVEHAEQAEASREVTAGSTSTTSLLPEVQAGAPYKVCM